MVLRTRARTSAAKAEMKNIATALEMYNADYEVYPLTADYPTDLEMGPGDVGIDAVAYMDPVPTTDGWGDAYGYASAGATYTLSCNAGTAAAVLTITDGQTSW
ncbi:MAG: type II secretion system protein GspG [Chloroflexi bacterium]|nr:type II secretion system protein GspG [Chloroflexota bacterium]